MINTLKNEIRNSLVEHFQKAYSQDINVVIEKPKNPEMGDLSIPVFVIVKALGKPLPEIANEVKAVLENNVLISEITVTGGFVNVKLSRLEVALSIINAVNNSYGESNVGNGKVVTIDYSAPNIAKSFGIGHLRSTIIGAALKKIYEIQGYKVVGINHLGDWGTQFGKLIYAYRTWGNDEAMKEAPIKELMRIYVKFHEEVENNPEIEDLGRLEFKKLEDGDQENHKLWEYFREISLQEFMEMYELLGVTFDSYNGEAFYNDKMAPVVKELEEKGLLIEDQGASIVDLGEDIAPALIKKSDGSTLYLTRDLAAVFYRHEHYQFDKALYVVGKEQSLHFKQMKLVLEKMGYDFAKNIEHIDFGLYLTDGKKMSTRKGRSVKLIDVITESCDMAQKYIEEKNPMLENKEEIARAVGVSAVVFNDLKNDRTNNIEFDLDQMVKFEGQTGPYLQYTIVRIKSILNNNEFNENAVIDPVFFGTDYAYSLIKTLGEYPSVLAKACEENAPHHISKFLLTLATDFNAYYANEKINVEDEKERNTKLLLLSKVLLVMENAFAILGMKTVERM